MELLDLFEMGSISEKKKNMLKIPGFFLFPAVDLAWKEEKAKNLQEIQSKSVCIAGDGQCDSPGHNAKYCLLRDGLCLWKNYTFLR